MISDQYVWLLWSTAFLIPWLVIFVVFYTHRRMMWRASLFTTPFGLTEPLFVPEYWSPPSLFDLALTIGFDIESLIFCFAIGGIGAVLYNLFSNKLVQPVDEEERSSPLHRHHYKALATPFVVFPVLYFLPWNPIYPSIIAMFAGAIGNILCRPDLNKKTWVGGLLFLGYYSIFMLGLEWSAPGYIERVWNLDNLTGIKLTFIPLEELLFAFFFGLYWSGVYEHFTWTRATPDN